MGLGPPVCMHCKVTYVYKHSYGWECPICKLNDTNNQKHLFDCGISIEELDGNLKFLSFIKGINTDKKEE